MKWITYDEVRHDGGNRWGREQYSIDFDTVEERKYKVPLWGVRVYEHGTIEVNNHGYNNPEWRHKIERMLGISFVFPKDLVGAKFEDPDTGEKVPKSALPKQLVYHDIERGRIYHVHDGIISFSSEHAQPFCEKFKYMTTDKEAFTARMEQLREYVEMGKALVLLGGDPGNDWLSYYEREMITSGRVPEGGMADEKFRKTCKSMARSEPALKKLVFMATKRVHRPNYLLVKES